MTKKEYSILILSLLFIVFSFSLISCAVQDSLEENIEKVEKVSETIEKAQDVKYWEEKWDYLGNEWKGIFLKNPGVAFLDRTLTKISIVFDIIFGVPYSFSLVFLAVVFLWIYFYFHISYLLFSTGFFENGLSYLGGLAICVIFAQFRFFEVIVLVVGRLVFSPEYAWTRILFLFVVFGMLGLFSYLNKKLSAYIRLNRKKDREKSAEVSQKAITAFADNFFNSSSKK